MPHDTGEDAPSRAAPPGPPYSRSRPPVPTAPPQPPPPTGRPLTPETLRERERERERTRVRDGAGRPKRDWDRIRNPRPGDGPAADPDGDDPEDPERFEAPPPWTPPEPFPGPVRGSSPNPSHPAPSARARPAARTVAVAACLVLGVGLLGGAGAGAWLTGDSGPDAAAAGDFNAARGLWHDLPVDRLFPRTLDGQGAGPGGADRRWVRVAVAPDSGCRHALDPALAKQLASVGCARLVRATYADETSTSVTTVGMLFTRADEKRMRHFRTRFAAQDLGERPDMMPRAYSARGTVAADFGDAQRASWTIRVLTDSPVVLYTVTGFADGRAVSEPEPADQATDKGATTMPAQAGLGHDTRGIADRIEKNLGKTTAPPGDSDQ